MSEETSLKKFIDENYRLIATMGIAAALTTLSTRLENGEYLAVTAFIMFVVLLLELLSLFPSSEKASLKLMIFRILCLNLLFFVGFYVLEYYTDFLLGFLPVLVVVFYNMVLALISFVQSLGIFPTIRKAQVLKYIIILGVAFFLSMMVGVWIREILL